MATEEKEPPFVHEFEGPRGTKYKIKFLGEGDATFNAGSTKRIIVGPGVVMEEITGMSLSQHIVCGCRIEFLADNHSEAAELAKGRITC